MLGYGCLQLSVENDVLDFSIDSRYAAISLSSVSFFRIAASLALLSFRSSFYCYYCYY